MPRIAIRSGLNLYYQQKGQGPDVMLIHGVTGNMAIWPLINLIDALAAEFRVTYFDLRGHGYSDTPPSGYTSADIATDLRDLQDALGVDSALLLGHSFGAVVALHAAVLYPDRVRGLVLSDAFFPALYNLEADITKWSGWRKYVEDSANTGLEVRPEHWFDVDRILQQAANLPDERRERFIRGLGKPALERLVRLARTTCGKDSGSVAGLTAQRIHSVRQPVLALYGEHSPFLATCRYLAERLPNCRAAYVPGAEHLAHEEQPEAFVRLVHQHLREMASGGWLCPDRTDAVEGAP